MSVIHCILCLAVQKCCKNFMHKHFIEVCRKDKKYINFFISKTNKIKVITTKNNN